MIPRKFNKKISFLLINKLQLSSTLKLSLPPNSKICKCFKTNLSVGISMLQDGFLDQLWILHYNAKIVAH